MATETVTTFGPGGVAAGAASATRIEEVPDETANHRLMQERMRLALASNQAFLALASPTAAQVRDQVRLLTRQTNAIIRTLINEGSTTADS